MSDELNDLLSILVQVLPYCFCALPLYSLMARRGMRAPWLAWVPVFTPFCLLALSDDMRRTEGRPGRLTARGCIAAVLMVCFVLLRWKTKDTDMFIRNDVLFLLHMHLFPAFAYILLQAVMYQAVYRLYCAYCAKYALLCLVFGLLIPFTIPIVLFIVRYEQKKCTRPREAATT